MKFVKNQEADLAINKYQLRISESHPKQLNLLKEK